MKQRQHKVLFVLSLCILLFNSFTMEVAAKTGLGTSSCNLGICIEGEKERKLRTTIPTEENRYFYADNPFYQGGYGLANCTCYAYGRAYEVLGTRPNLSTGDASSFYAYNMMFGFYEYGQTPKVGSVGCFKGGSSGEGHVIYVEGVNEDGTINVTESNWHGRQYPEYAFRYLTNIIPEYNWPHLTFQGYIYVATDDAENPVGTSGGETSGIANQNTRKHPGNKLMPLTAGLTMEVPLNFD